MAVRSPIRSQAAGPLLAAALLAGCAGGGAGRDGAPGVAPVSGAACTDFLHALDVAVEGAGVRDAEATRLPGFTYLRVNRVLAAPPRPVPGDGTFARWAEQMAALDREGRAIEIANLPDAAIPAGIARSALVRRASKCGLRLLRRDLRDPTLTAALAQAARVPDDYSTARRAAGLYPLTAIPFLAGVQRLHRSLRAELAGGGRNPAPGTLLRRYAPPAGGVLDAATVATMLRRAPRTPAGRPEPRPEDRDRLLAAFAPTLQVETREPADRIGAVRWGEGGLPEVDVSRPTVYTRTSHARLQGRWRLQLVYLAWFPARPPAGPLDLLAGRLDGVYWRVTLGEDGRALAYDSAHACGCYHLLVPARPLGPRPPPARFEEPVLVSPAVAREPGPRALRLAAGTHYLRAVAAPDPAAPATRYALRPARDLRSLPLPGGGRRSLYRPDGLVAGTERAERWLFWPMGVLSPGAMRQWGRHAIAFVGRRHLDDPDLLRRYLAPQPGGVPARP